MYTIASWNINSVRIRISLLKKLIKKIDPDLLLLQEIKCSNEEFPDIFSDLDYNVVTNGQKGKYGVAILIKKKFDFKEIDIESEILNIESRTNFIFVEKLNLKVLNVYTPNGNPTENKEKFKFKLDWMNEIAKLSTACVNNFEHLLIGGDFNVLEDEKDVTNFNNWENDALGHIEIRKKFREILASGLTNVIRVFDEPGKKFSYWDYQRACWERNDGLLIDHFLITPQYLSHVKNIEFETNFRGMEKPSDHIPIWINLNI